MMSAAVSCAPQMNSRSPERAIDDLGGFCEARSRDLDDGRDALGFWHDDALAHDLPEILGQRGFTVLEPLQVLGAGAPAFSVRARREAPVAVALEHVLHDRARFEERDVAVLHHHGAFEPTRMCRLGRTPGSSPKLPPGITTRWLPGGRGHAWGGPHGAFRAAVYGAQLHICTCESIAGHRHPCIDTVRLHTKSFVWKPGGALGYLIQGRLIR
jgi:hypothetical protein